MHSVKKGLKELKPIDLRSILKYVPQFRHHIFIIGIEGSLIDDEASFDSLLTDIAVLRRLAIKVVLVHDVTLPQPSQRKKGLAGTDATTLQRAMADSGRVSHRFMQGLTQAGLHYAFTNAVEATEVGIVKGKDQQFSGKVAKVHLRLIHHLLQEEIVPVCAPIAHDRTGQPLWIDADLLASELALRLEASKLIYLTTDSDLFLNGRQVRNLSVQELIQVLKRPNAIDNTIAHKLQYAVQTLKGRTPRVHILDGRVSGALLTELFDTVGIGTMIYANAYQQIRPALKKDVIALYSITRNAIEKEALRDRSLREIERDLAAFYIYEIDESIVGCVALFPLARSKVIELACLYIQPFYREKGAGQKLVAFACDEAKRRGFRKIVALSTQSYSFFQKICDFEEGSIKDIPTLRRKDYEKTGRHSRILVKRL